MSGRNAVLAMVLLALVGVACGSADNSSGDEVPAVASTPAPAPETTVAPTPAPTLPPQPLPGTVSLDVSGVTDAEGLVMLAVIGDGQPNRAFAAACAIVDAEPFSFSGAYLPITGNDPCSLGTDPVEFEPGSYEVTVAVLQGGSRSPEQCTQTGITVDGDVTVHVTGLGPPTDCQF